GRATKARRHGDEAQLRLEFDGVEAGSSLRPVRGSEFEETFSRPVGHDANHLSEVALGINPVQLAAGDEGVEVGGGLRVVVGTEDEPRLPAGGDDSQGIFAVVVVHAQATVIEEAPQSELL